MDESNSYKSNFHRFLDEVEGGPHSAEEVSQSLRQLADFVQLLNEIDQVNTAKEKKYDTKSVATI